MQQSPYFNIKKWKLFSLGVYNKKVFSKNLNLKRHLSILSQFHKHTSDYLNIIFEEFHSCTAYKRKAWTDERVFKLAFREKPFLHSLKLKDWLVICRFRSNCHTRVKLKGSSVMWMIKCVWSKIYTKIFYCTPHNRKVFQCSKHKCLFKWDLLEKFSLNTS